MRVGVKRETERERESEKGSNGTTTRAQTERERESGIRRHVHKHTHTEKEREGTYEEKTERTPKVGNFQKLNRKSNSPSEKLPAVSAIGMRRIDAMRSSKSVGD